MRELILVEILAVPAERSRGRHNPRVVKRKMSSFPTKARAAPPSGRVFRYEDHIRVVAPPGRLAGRRGPGLRARDLRGARGVEDARRALDHVAEGVGDEGVVALLVQGEVGVRAL